MARLMAIRLIKAAEHRRMPWKNGGGETVEIAVDPQGASLADFDWRISMATVAADGPFSAFPGIDRTLSILDGSGMVLDIEGRTPVRLTVDDAPLHFAADVATSATLVGGPITDLNVMSRRTACSHGVRKLRVAGTERLTSDAETLIVFCHRGNVRLTTGNDDARLSALDTAISQVSGDMLLVSEAPADVFLVEFGKA
ncbi:HutD family protein [Rhizobiaceae bacterium n13]|uniref:HutD family protein n=1 Tax=Ferirhizobium litorale TaxID=2927786 RepID=A0AAE3QBH4_9HYPH|nr:HutD family protein [Fererhizobium litorale]MDI7861981.1 HutD family protein [Fererhizobium litorale]MDI7922747.1 HutD family protein [Fererhizobium litorale]